MRAYSLSCFFFFCKTWNVVKLTIEHKFSQAASTGLELSGFKADQQLQMCTFFLVMKYDLTKLCTIWTVLYTCLIWKFCTWEYIQITRQRMTSFIYRYTYKQNTMKEKHKQLAFCTSYGDRTQKPQYFKHRWDQFIRLRCLKTLQAPQAQEDTISEFNVLNFLLESSVKVNSHTNMLQ